MGKAISSSWILLSSCLLATSLAGCAYTTATAVLTGEEEGFRYPTCYPFLVVSGGQHQLLMVPNPKRERAVQFGTFLAKNNVNVTFNECGPTDVKSDQDSTTVAVALINLLNKGDEPAPAASARGGPPGGEPAGGTFQVFAFMFDDMGQYRGLEPQITPGSFVQVRGLTPATKDLTPKDLGTKPGEGKPDGAPKPPIIPPKAKG